MSTERLHPRIQENTFHSSPHPPAGVSPGSPPDASSPSVSFSPNHSVPSTSTSIPVVFARSFASSSSFSHCAAYFFQNPFPFLTCPFISLSNTLPSSLTSSEKLRDHSTTIISLTCLATSISLGSSALRIKCCASDRR